MTMIERMRNIADNAVSALGGDPGVVKFYATTEDVTTLEGELRSNPFQTGSGLMGFAWELTKDQPFSLVFDMGDNGAIRVDVFRSQSSSSNSGETSPA